MTQNGRQWGSSRRSGSYSIPRQAIAKNVPIHECDCTVHCRMCYCHRQWIKSGGSICEFDRAFNIWRCRSCFFVRVWIRKTNAWVIFGHILRAFWPRILKSTFRNFSNVFLPFRAFSADINELQAGNLTEINESSSGRTQIKIDFPTKLGSPGTISYVVISGQTVIWRFRIFHFSHFNLIFLQTSSEIVATVLSGGVGQEKISILVAAEEVPFIKLKYSVYGHRRHEGGAWMNGMSFWKVTH